MSTSQTQCPFCFHGRQKNSRTITYPCEDCGGTGILYWCDCCEQFKNPELFEDPNEALCTPCKTEGLHLRYWAEGLSIFDRDSDNEMIASTFITPSTTLTEAMNKAILIANLLNNQEE